MQDEETPLALLGEKQKEENHETMIFSLLSSTTRKKWHPLIFLSLQALRATSAVIHVCLLIMDLLLF